MSLDVNLIRVKTLECDCGTVHEIDRENVYWANITHNLTAMTTDAGIYYELWRPSEIGITKAHQLIEPLREGVKNMMQFSTRLKEFSASNGWGTYEQFVPWVQQYLDACIEYPDALIEISI